ncbi:hypothetical protein Bhyg_09556 [Pseudolycoriella hygida]|uniref:Uncharacterized protein n=1 Tax=Pseudolycoriella hygida TaxID=35572 RepID=A0A9Q0N6R6_9DIPT|nr:hypothetical protein Bhyg_09556 [Pseudolycoriella hygida]
MREQEIFVFLTSKNNMKLVTVILLCGLSMSITNADSKRFKRFLIFPASAPTRMQLIAGIGIPVDLEYESVTIGYVLKSQYFLPDNTSTILHFLQEPFEPLTRPIERRRRNIPLISNENQTDSNEPSKSYEKYDVEAVEIGKGVMATEAVDDSNSPYSDEWNGVEDEEYSPSDYGITKQSDFSTARWTLYKGIEAMADRRGWAGHACMLRSICESAHAPFSFSSGIVAELMHIIMTPSSSKDFLCDNSINEYHRAEEIGKSGAPCDQVFRECTVSVVDKFSGIYNTVQNIAKLLG